MLEAGLSIIEFWNSAYSLAPMLRTKCCFMKKSCHFQRGVSHFKHTIIELISHNRAFKKVRYIFLILLKGPRVSQKNILTLADSFWAPWVRKSYLLYSHHYQPLLQIKKRKLALNLPHKMHIKIVFQLKILGGGH